MLEFRLLYSGELPPKHRGTAAVRHHIRRQFHPQLRALWQSHPVLSRFFRREHEPDEGLDRRIRELAQQFDRFGFRFVPLLRREIAFACSLDILILRRSEYRIFDGRGDLDNRIKSLIDALKMPIQRDDTGGVAPGEDEDPFFCLLEDDALVYDFTVTTDTLLQPSTEAEPKDVTVIVKVKVMVPFGTFSPYDFY